MWPIDCLLIVLDAHMLSHNAYELETGLKAQPRPTAPWALVLGPGPKSLMAEHMCIKGNQ